MSLTLLVLADPSASWLKLLGNLGSDVNVLVSNDLRKSARARPQADVIVNGTSNPPLLSAAIPPRDRPSGSTRSGPASITSSCPEILASPLPLTNGRGVFRRPLAEWTIGADAVLRLQHAPHDPAAADRRVGGVHHRGNSGKTLGIVGIRRDRQHGCGTGAAIWHADRCALRRRPELFKEDPLGGWRVSLLRNSTT